MKHDHRARLQPFKMKDWFWRMIAQWRAQRFRREALMVIKRRENAHLLEDVGLCRPAATCDPRNAMSARDRHRFWML